MQPNSVEIRCDISNIKVEERQEGVIESRTISGYAAKFDTWSQVLGGWFKETIARGAFDECDMSDVVMCYNHNSGDILARTLSGTLSLFIDEIGLRFSFEAPCTTLGNDMLELVKRGDIDKCSFAFTIKEDSWIYADDNNKLTADERTILKIKKLYDCALVIHPAYKDTEASVRNLQEKKENYFRENRNNGSSSRARLCQTLKYKETI